MRQIDGIYAHVRFLNTWMKIRRSWRILLYSHVFVRARRISLLSRMADSTPSTPSVWQALDAWAEKLKPWQRRILAYAIRGRSLNEAQITEVYRLFLEESLLRKPEKREDVPVDNSRRSARESTKPLRLDGISELSGFNALPDGASLVFG